MFPKHHLEQCNHHKQWRHIVLLLKDEWIPMICTWYFSRINCNIIFSTTHCSSNVSIERTESITLVIIIDLIHLVAWSYLPFFRKHIYSLLTGGNIVGVLEVNVLEVVEEIRCEWCFGVEMILCYFFCFTRLHVVIVCDVCIILGGILGTQNIIVLVLVCYIRDRRCC